jgi:hypothetical protein
MHFIYLKIKKSPSYAIPGQAGIQKSERRKEETEKIIVLRF